MKMKPFMVFMSVLVFGLFISLIACDLDRVSDLDTTMNKGMAQFEVEVPIMASRTIHTDGNVAEVWVKVFDSNGNHVLTTGANSIGGVSWLTKTGAKWSGTVLIPTPYPSNLTFSVWAEDASNQHLYSGSTPVVASGGGSVTVATSAGYAIGDLGPGGGKIFADYGSAFFVANGWRYLEAAASDLANTWLGIPLEPDHNVDANGDVVKGSTVIMTTYDWYWGPPDNAVDAYGTLKDSGKGLANTNILSADSVSGVTPKITKGKGRPEVSDTDRLRRDLSKTLKTKTIGGKNDWFVPSIEELDLIYDNKGTLGISSGIYWSSSETAESGDGPPAADYPSPYTQYPIVVGSSSYDSEDVHAWVQNFSDGAQSQIWRNELARVRPVRRF
ncbi:MAG: hypothetical protein CVV52_08720 [Spirochaetae bacterium HGW-Spirochaetae-8]|nr:MAG: hypothetical protein CVV52_08720 [Spirochaetae bacterium HGW-Spirochaetae-8]